MKTIKRTIGAVSAIAVSALMLMAGCVAGESEDGADMDPQNSDDAVTGCTFPKNKGGGTITSDQGCFGWSGKSVRFTSKGVGSTSSTAVGTVSTPAQKGDYEIVAFSASHGGNESTEVNTFFDASRMTGQGFRAIGVRGETDKKIELWVRQNNGQTTIKAPDKAVEYNILVLNHLDVSLNLGAISKQTIENAGEPWKVPAKTGTGVTVLAYFGDDSDEVTSTSGGELLYNQWGFGDGDSLNVMLYAPGTTLPSTLGVNNHAKGGRQYVGIVATFPKN